jgi:heat shock protein HslJ
MKRLRYGPLALSCAALTACQSLSPFTQESPGALADTYWKLIRTDGQEAVVHGDAREPYLLLTQHNHQVHGFTGCNEITGRYQQHGAQLHFAAQTDTQLVCAGKMALEHAYLNALNQAAHARIRHHRLILLNTENHPLARFQARLMD